MDVLSDLVKSIQEKRTEVPTRRASTQRQVQRRTEVPLVKSGPGGVMFNFAGVCTNPMVAQYNAHLQRHADPAQIEIAKGQAAEVNQAFGEYINKGQHQFELDKLPQQEEGKGVHSGWDKQLSGSTDQQVTEAFKKGILDCNEGQQSPAASEHTLPKGDFSKSSMQMGGEQVQATSETDAALIEMMKSGGVEFE